MTNPDPTRRRRIRPGIYQRNGRFVVRYRDDGQRVRDRTFGTLREAEAFKAEMHAAKRERIVEAVAADDPTQLRRLAAGIRGTLNGDWEQTTRTDLELIRAGNRLADDLERRARRLEVLR